MAPRNPAIGDRFRVEQGDGDPHFFAEPRLVRLVEAGWFPGIIPGFGDAMLFIIEDDGYAGEYLAITSHVRKPLLTQFIEKGSASAVIHRIKNPTASYAGKIDEFDPIGMAPVYWMSW